MRFILSVLSWLFTLLLTFAVLGGVAAYVMFQHYARDLPDYSQLAHYDPPTVSRLYAADDRLLAEYATQRRVFVPLAAVPKRVIHAFLAAEDRNFYQHQGIDFRGLLRATYTNILNYGQGRSLVGGSTITQQVVKNFLLTDEKSLARKAREAILALRISQAYSKDKILELYLNEIFLGLRSYGIAEAALNYFDKPLDELRIEECALLAAEPKGPSLYDPHRNPEAAKNRRDWVIRRMQEDGYITEEEAKAAMATPITLRTRSPDDTARGDYFAEEVRRLLIDRYGDKALYEGGMVVYTTLDSKLQDYADHALRAALQAYDRKHGWRGPLTHMPTKGFESQLKTLARNKPLPEGQRLAVVTAIEKNKAVIGFSDGKSGFIPAASLEWAKKSDKTVTTGDVVVVGPLSEAQRKGIPAAELKTAWDLQQVPEVNGAMVVMDPHSGRVLALSGGYNFAGDSFDRATQAHRQPGSSFKPFVYLAGLENGFTPATTVLDAPVELSQGAGLPMWKPKNHEDEYLGPTTLRVGLERSRNTMTVRLTQMIGIDKVLEVGKRFGIYDNPPRNFSIALGSAETTLLRLTNAYSMIVNGGKRLTPGLVERIDDRQGKIIYRRDIRECKGCALDASQAAAALDTPPPVPQDNREQVVDPRVAYQMISMLEGVVERGTGKRALVLGRPTGGKTGTTNDSMDTWFIGFTPNLVAGVFVGYDKPRTLGKKETGASVALPGFIDFMQSALKDKPVVPFRIPQGIKLVQVDLKTGQPVAAPAKGQKVVDEAFVTGGPLWMPGGGEGQALPPVPGEPEIPGDQQQPAAVPVLGAPPANLAVPPSNPANMPFPPPAETPAPPALPAPTPVVGTGGLY